MMRPLVRRRVNPNHVTTARLAVGMLAMAGFATGGYLWTNIGALLFVLSSLLDHADGELARMTGQTSRFGHVYDLASDALIHVAAVRRHRRRHDRRGPGSAGNHHGCHCRGPPSA